MMFGDLDLPQTCPVCGENLDFSHYFTMPQNDKSVNGSVLSALSSASSNSRANPSPFAAIELECGHFMCRQCVRGHSRGGVVTCAECWAETTMRRLPTKMSVLARRMMVAQQQQQQQQQDQLEQQTAESSRINSLAVSPEKTTGSVRSEKNSRSSSATRPPRAPTPRSKRLGEETLKPGDFKLDLSRVVGSTGESQKVPSGRKTSEGAMITPRNEVQQNSAPATPALSSIATDPSPPPSAHRVTQESLSRGASSEGGAAIEPSASVSRRERLSVTAAVPPAPRDENSDSPLSMTKRPSEVEEAARPNDSRRQVDGLSSEGAASAAAAADQLDKPTVVAGRTVIEAHKNGDDQPDENAYYKYSIREELSQKVAELRAEKRHRQVVEMRKRTELQSLPNPHHHMQGIGAERPNPGEDTEDAQKFPAGSSSSPSYQNRQISSSTTTAEQYHSSATPSMGEDLTKGAFPIVSPDSNRSPSSRGGNTGPRQQQASPSPEGQSLTEPQMQYSSLLPPPEPEPNHSAPQPTPIDHRSPSVASSSVASTSRSFSQQRYQRKAEKLAAAAASSQTAADYGVTSSSSSHQQNRDYNSSSSPGVPIEDINEAYERYQNNTASIPTQLTMKETEQQLAHLAPPQSRQAAAVTSRMPLCPRPGRGSHRLELYCIDTGTLCSVQDARALVGKQILPVEDAVSIVRAKQEQWLQQQHGKAAHMQGDLLEVDEALDKVKREGLEDTQSVERYFRALQNRLDEVRNETMQRVGENNAYRVEALLTHRRLIEARRDRLLKDAQSITEVLGGGEEREATASPLKLLSVRKPEEPAPLPHVPHLTRLTARVDLVKATRAIADSVSIVGGGDGGGGGGGKAAFSSSAEERPRFTTATISAPFRPSTATTTTASHRSNPDSSLGKISNGSSAGSLSKKNQNESSSRRLIAPSEASTAKQLFTAEPQPSQSTSQQQHINPLSSIPATDPAAAASSYYAQFYSHQSQKAAKRMTTTGGSAAHNRSGASIASTYASSSSRHNTSGGSLGKVSTISSRSTVSSNGRSGGTQSQRSKSTDSQKRGSRSGNSSSTSLTFSNKQDYYRRSSSTGSQGRSRSAGGPVQQERPPWSIRTK